MSKSIPKTASYSVVPGDDGWIVKAAGDRVRTYDTQAEAVEAAQQAARTKGGEIRVQGRDGRWRETFTIGRDPFTKISAVEGIKPTKAAAARTRDYDLRNMAPDQRRTAIIKAHTPKN